MEIQELFKTVESIQRNAPAGFVVVIYYIIVYWQKIKDGLGLTTNRKIDLEKTEKNYQLLKLRIEIEQLKKSSGLDQETLDRLEQEMLLRQEVKKKSRLHRHKNLLPYHC